MWFKRVLLGYCAASLAVTFIAASITKDATVPRRQHVVERLTFPSLERRQQSFQNQTSSSKATEKTSSVASTSITLSTSELAQTSTITNTPSIIITLGPSSSPTPTPSTVEVSSLLSGVSSDNGITSSDARSVDTDSVTSSLASSTAGQHPSETSRFTSSQTATSQRTSSPTIIDIIYVINSSTDVPQSTSTTKILSISPGPKSSEMPELSSEVIISSETMTIPSVTPISVSIAESSQAPFNTRTNISSESTASSTAIETPTYIVFVPTLRITATESSSIVVNPSTEPTSQSLPSPTTPSEQQSTAPSTSPSAFASHQGSSAVILESKTLIVIGSSSSLLHEPLSTSSNERAPDSTSLPTPSSSGGLQESSTNTEEVLSTLALQSTTLVATNSDKSSATLQAITASVAASSSLTLPAFQSGPNSTISTVTSLVEPSQPSPLSSSLESTLVLTTSAIQVSLSLSSQQPLTNSTAELTSVRSDVVSTLGPFVGPSSQTASTPLSSVASSFETVSTSEQVPNGSQFVPTHGVDDISSMSTRFANPSDLATTTGVTPYAHSSIRVVTSSGPMSAPTRTGSLLSDSSASASSATFLVSTGPGSLVSTSLSQVATSVTTAEPPVENSTSVLTSSEAVATGSSSLTVLPVFSLGTSVLSSATSGIKTISSFAPSETPSASATSLIGSSLETFSETLQTQFSSTFQSSGTQNSFSEESPSATSNVHQSASSTVPLSRSKALQSQTPIAHESVSIGSSYPSIPSSNAPSLPSFVSGTQVLPSQNTTSIVVSISSTPYTIDTAPTSEASSGSETAIPSSTLQSLVTETPSGISSYASSSITTTMDQFGSNPLSPAGSNSTQAGLTASIMPGIITATFSTVYVSSIRSSAIDLSTVAFSLLNSVTGAAVDQTGGLVSSVWLFTLPSTTSRTQVPTSESLVPSGRPSVGANSTWSLPVQSSLSTSTGLPGRLNSSTAITVELGITFSRSALPSGVSTGTASSLNATQAETLQTASRLDSASSSPAKSAASVTSRSESRAQPEISGFKSASGSKTASTTDRIDSEHTNTLEVPQTPTSTPSQTAAAGSPPPLSTSQTAGVAVGGTTFLLIAVVAAVFIARRYHTAKHGKHMSTGSVYPKVAYLYDPNTGGDDGDAEALTSRGTGGMPPGGSTSRAVHDSPKHLRCHSTGKMSMNRFTNPGNPFRGSILDPAIHRYSESEYARMDTTRALSAAVAGYAGAPRHLSSYTRYPSDNSNPFSDHVIPSPTFAPFSPDDIRRPELKKPQSTKDGRGEYSQMSVNPYAYLNTAASMYPPISPYGRPPSHGPSPSYNTRRHTVDSNPFADPFEHDLLLQVDERDRTSDSVTIFASSPNLMSPRTPRTQVGPKLPVRQPNGMTSARSLLSPVAAKYMQKAQEVKIPRKSVVSPVLVQVGRSPVIKPFSPPSAAPEPLGWDDIKRHSGKRFSDERSVPAPLKFASPVIRKKPVSSSHSRTKPSLTGAGQAVLAGNGLSLTVKIPHMYNKSVGLDVPRVHGDPNLAHEDVSSDPVVREKRSRELRFANPALIGKEF